MPHFDIPALEGSSIRLEPLDLDHETALLAAASADPSLYALSAVPLTAQTVRRYIQRACEWREAGTAAPFAIVRLRDGAVVGSTRFFDVERWEWPQSKDDPSRAFDVCEIGYTWLRADAVRTQVNTEAKLLMLQQAFERWKVRRICFHTDERNDASRNALLAIGATFEGILRAHRLAADVRPRNSARFSILESEWPRVKAHLEERLRRKASESPAGR
jgi:RimJ/RimL family protein N-acetyltransferase